MRNNFYFENRLSFLTGVSRKYINYFEVAVSEFDIIHDVYLKIYNSEFNSEDHFLGVFCKLMKFEVLSERRQKNKHVMLNDNFCYFFQEEKTEKSRCVDEVLIEHIEDEQNVRHKALLYLLGSGKCYDSIADNLGISRKNIRFHTFEAKRKLLNRLKTSGIEIENNIRTRASINLAFETQEAMLYDDFPLDTSDIKLLILFVLSKSNEPLSSHEIIFVIAKNRNMSFSNTKNSCYFNLKKLENEGKIGEVNQKYFKK